MMLLRKSETLVLVLLAATIRLTTQQNTDSSRNSEKRNVVYNALFKKNDYNIVQQIRSKRMTQLHYSDFERDSLDFMLPDRYYEIKEHYNDNNNWDIHSESDFSSQPYYKPPRAWRFPETTPPQNKTPKPDRQNSESSNLTQKCEQSCLSTNQYDPVCGDDSKTYFNEGKLRCAQRCGKNVKILIRHYPCPTKAK